MRNEKDKFEGYVGGKISDIKYVNITIESKFSF